MILSHTVSSKGPGLSYLNTETEMSILQKRSSLTELIEVVTSNDIISVSMV